MQINDLFNILHNSLESQNNGKKVSLKDMANSLGISMRTYQDWKLGRAKPQAASTVMKMLGGLRSMSALTKQERDGLDEIFMSIHTNRDKYTKLKEFSSLIMSKNISLNTSKFLKVAKLGLKESKLSQFITLFSKKKKNLSK